MLESPYIDNSDNLWPSPSETVKVVTEGLFSLNVMYCPRIC